MAETKVMHMQDHVSNGLKAERWDGPSYGKIAASRIAAVVAFFLFATLICKWSAEAGAATASYVVPMAVLTIALSLCLGGSVLLHPLKGYYYGTEATWSVSLAVALVLALGGSLFLVGVAHFFRYEELLAGPGVSGRTTDLWRIYEAGAGRAFYLHDGYVALERQVESVAPVFSSQSDMLSGGRIIAWALPVEPCLVAPCEPIPADSCALPPEGRGHGGLCGTVHDLGGLARDSDTIAAWASVYDLVGAAAVLDASYANRTAVPGMLFLDPEDQWWHRTTYYAGILILFSYLGVEFLTIFTWIFCAGGVDFAKCKQEFDDGSVYHGQFRGTRFVGKGRMTWMSGDEYEGMYLDSKMHGQGVYRHADGSNYRGQYNDDLRHGYGVFTFTDGTLYEGEWQVDQPDGEGRVIYPNGKVCMGMFKDGQQDIKGMGEKTVMKTMAKTGGPKAPTPPPAPVGMPVLPQSWPGVPAGLGLLPAGFPALPPLPGVAAPPAPAGFPNSAGPPRPPGQAPNASMPGLPMPPALPPPKGGGMAVPGSGSLRLPVIAPYAPPPMSNGRGLPRPPGSKPPPPPPPGSSAAHGGLRRAGRPEATVHPGQIRHFIPPPPPAPKLSGPRPNPMGVTGLNLGGPALPPLPRRL